jgi:hypothetical protein
VLEVGRSGGSGAAEHTRTDVDCEDFLANDP